MKKTFLLTAVLLAVACAPKATVTVVNPLGIDRSAELVEIPVDKLGAIPLGLDDTYVVTNAAGEAVPSQWTSDDLLVFQSGLGANETARFTITAGAPRRFETRTTGRFVPERHDDFVWENDRVAFRIYGAALAPIDGPSGGIDALYKRTDTLIVGRWYAEAAERGLSYHDDHGTGLDDYKVGPTLGAGAAAPWVDSALVLVGNFTAQELLDNGPLRTTFRLTYPPLTIHGRPVASTRTISIDAGAQLTRVEQEYGVSEPIQVAVGYPLHADSVESSAGANRLLLSEPATPKASGVWLGAVLPQPIEGAFENSYEVPAGEKGAGTYRHILALQRYTPGEPLVYYTGFGWERSGGWTAQRFAEYLDHFAAALDTPFLITIE